MKKQRNKKVSIIVPTYNESEIIQKVLKGIKKLSKLYLLEIIVVDGNSTDQTVSLAKKEGVIVLTRRKKYGKGADFWYASKKAKGEYVVQIDADNQFFPEEIPLLINALEEGADVVIANRRNPKDALVIRKIGNLIFSCITSILVGRRIYDVVAGFKAFRKKVLLSLDLTEKHFGYEGEIVVKTIVKGYKLEQVPVSYRIRSTGKSQVNPLRDGFLTIWSLLKTRVKNI